jgi:hypothetical protein
MLQQQGEAAGDDPVAACESAVRSIRAAFAQPRTTIETQETSQEKPAA